MTPTLIGRWQSRIYLLATIGVLVTLPFAFKDGVQQFHPVFFWVLFYVGLFGLGWDILYTRLQKLLWDHDWPGAIQLIAAIFEGVFLALLINYVGLPNVSRDNFDLVTYIIHYSVVWVFIYMASWVVMRLMFPRARYRGGAWIGKWPKVN
jgi:Kef-type K+ transport system membrane component KefB